MNPPIKLLLVDDHALVRASLGERLQSEPGLVVVAMVANAEEAITVAFEKQPDIILMDIDMPGLACFEAATTIQDRLPNVRIIFVSAFFHDRYIEQALGVKASGYVTKSEPPEKVVEAIRAVASGRSYFSAEVQSRIIVDSGGARLNEQSRSRVSTLTPRELQILRYIARGLTQKEIAQIMHLSATTVHTHSINLMTKLDIHNRVELARFAIREGLAEA